MIRAQQARIQELRHRCGAVAQRSGGSWPGSVFTGEPLKLAAGHFGLGFGDGAHAPDEYCLIESKNPNVLGMNGAVKSFVDFLYMVGAMRG